MEYRDAVKFLVVFSCVVGGLMPLVSDGIRRHLGVGREVPPNFTETCTAHHYRAEEHLVRTADGYLLTVFRVGRAVCAPRRPPVLLMHGLLQSADGFLDPGPRAGLPYLLADQCFDVWVGNTRGNYYARRHEWLDPDWDAQFWDFGVEEIGLNDVPATIDYVLRHAGAQKLNYMGYSQGAGTFFIMCSEMPEYCDKVGLQISLAPAVRMTNTRSTLFREVASGLSRLHGVLSYLGYNEVFARNSIYRQVASLTCEVSERLCSGMLTLIDAAHAGSLTDATLHHLFAHFPAGASIKMFVKYAQGMTSEGFEKFDHGPENLRLYGASSPPAYNLSAVASPVLLLYSDNDYLVDARDVRWLQRQLRNVVDAIKIESPLWNHFDFGYSQHIPTLVFPHIHKYLMLYSEP